MKIWLSRERSGLFMATRIKPDKHRIQGTRELEYYVPYGDAVGLRGWCSNGVKMIFGIDIPIGEQVQVNAEGSLVTEEPIK